MQRSGKAVLSTDVAQCQQGDDENCERVRCHRFVTCETAAIRYAQSGALDPTWALTGSSPAGVVFCSMRHEPSGSLSLPDRELSREEQLRAVATAARGAHEMHEAGLVHRAIGPTNILLGRAGAVLAEPAVGHLLTSGHTLIGLGAGPRAGRLEFVAPELMRGRPAGRASDIWSLGVTLHLVLSGHGLFPALVSADPFTAVRIYLRSQPEPGEDLGTAERGVIVRSGTDLGQDGHMRVTYGTRPENDRFLAALDGVLAEVPAGA